MRTRFEGQSVWITGASAGIGEALVYAFAREGARLLLSARRADLLERVAERCQPAALVLPLDLEHLASLPSKVDEALERAGRIDVMVHCGGMSQRSRIAETSLEVDQRLMRVNYFGAVALTKALLPSMVRQRRGHFVVISSLVGVFGVANRSGYAASKHALHGFFEALRMEHHADGVAVTVVCPGYVRTDVARNALRGDGAPSGILDPQIERGIAPERCAAAILDATARRATEVYVGGPERLGAYAKRFAPGLLARALSALDERKRNR